MSETVYQRVVGLTLHIMRRNVTQGKSPLLLNSWQFWRRTVFPPQKFFRRPDLSELAKQPKGPIEAVRFKRPSHPNNTDP
jgi:hypothetical protein